MALFGRKKPEPAPAPKSARVTRAELETAVEAAVASMSRESEEVRVLEELLACAVDHVKDGSVASFADADDLPALGDVDDALSEVCKDELGLAARHVRALKKAREMLAEELQHRRTEQTAQDSGLVTRAEFAAFAKAVAFALSDLETASERPGFKDGDLRLRLRRRIGGAGADALELLVGLLDDIRVRDSVLERKRAAAKATSARAFNF